jgi:hypothetical protein
MSTVKISDLAALTTINSNTANTLLVGVDIPTGATGKFTARTLARGLYSNEVLNVGTRTVDLPDTIAQFSLNSASYIQTNLVNTDDGGSADFVVTANSGTDTTYFIDMGYANKDFNPGSEINSLGTSINRLDGYIYTQGSTSNTWGGNLVVGAVTTGKEIRFIAGGGAANAVVAKMSSSALTLNRNVVFADGSSQNTSSGSAGVYANSSFEKANSAGQYANSAFGAANSAGAFANAASDSASSGLINAGIADTKAVTSGRYANSAFSTANSASIYANGAFLAANTPSLTANSAAEYANSAFLQANTPSYVANSAALYANGAFLAANTPSYVANSAALYANGAFTAANTADSKAVTAGSYANSAFSVANTTAFWASSAGSYANAAFLAANTPSYVANSAAIYANGAFTAANNALLQIYPTVRIPAGNQTTLAIDYSTDTVIKANLVADLTITHSNFNTGKAVEVWLVNADNNSRTITHGISALNSTTNSLTFTIPATSSAHLRFFNINSDLANTFVKVSKP